MAESLGTGACEVGRLDRGCVSSGHVESVGSHGRVPDSVGLRGHAPNSVGRGLTGPGDGSIT
jgi:hypothetical protein